jgi:flagellar hook-associated protein 3 FlgL
MQIDGISTLVMNNLLKDAIHRSQQGLAEANIEVSTGRHADVGLTLGAATGRDLVWRAQLSEMQALTDGNKLAATRLDLTQSALSSMRDVANTFLQTLTGARGAADGQQIAKAAADSALQSLTGLLNTSFGGQYLFGGIASDRKPVADYPGTPPGAAKASVDAAFLASFGMSQSAAGVSGITPAAMQAFLDTPFDALFSPAPWGSDWSQASSANQTTRLDTGQRITSATNANADAFRQLAQAFTMVLDLGEGQLSQSTFQTIADQALKLTGQGILGIGNEQSQLGIAQNDITSATERISLRITAITGGIQDAEGVDSYAAATRATALQTQLETSYALTARISKLSILNYL